MHHEVTNMDAAITKTGPLVWTSSGSIASSDCSVHTHRYWQLICVNKCIERTCIYAFYTLTLCTDPGGRG